ncbi:hypothetical protein ACIBG0_34980 [Nocardia sp. NPDC050630]|uniref:hypothetical protein n=1 Tax=Nocardia sp. NPDC050630 TaxID=3364321 RepID=UPI00378B6F61
MTYRPRREFIFVSDAGMPLPRVAELIAELTSQYGGEYVLVLSRAVDSASRNDQSSYKTGLNTAISVLTDGARDKETATDIVIDHLGLFLAAFRADLQRVERNDASPDFPSRDGS